MNQAYPLSYTYNLAGALTAETYPSGRVISTTYDAAGRFTTLSGSKSGEGVKTYAANVHYAAHGAVDALQLGNSKWEHTTFNNRLQAIQIGLGTSSTDSSLLRLDYDYGTTNNNGNLLSQRIVGGVGDVTQSYSYDAVNRLLNAEEKTTTSQAQQWKQAFSYDAYGNARYDSDATLYQSFAGGLRTYPKSPPLPQPPSCMYL